MKAPKFAAMLGITLNIRIFPFFRCSPWTYSSQRYLFFRGQEANGRQQTMVNSQCRQTISSETYVVFNTRETCRKVVNSLGEKSNGQEIVYGKTAQERRNISILYKGISVRFPTTYCEWRKMSSLRIAFSYGYILIATGICGRFLAGHISGEVSTGVT